MEEEKFSGDIFRGFSRLKKYILIKQELIPSVFETRFLANVYFV